MIALMPNAAIRNSRPSASRIGPNGSPRISSTASGAGTWSLSAEVRCPATPPPQRLRNRIEYPILSFDGIPLVRVAVKRLVTAVMDLLKEFGVTVEDLRRVVFHQANRRLPAAVLDRLGIARDQMYSVLERYGNASSASLPIALDHAVREGQLGSGDLILLGTFGGGLTWGAGLVRW
jgi:3-oxoacyl-[acyl-carrier-protein] synthase III